MAPKRGPKERRPTVRSLELERRAAGEKEAHAREVARGRGLYNPFEEWHRARNERKLLERFNRYSPLIVLQWAEAVTPGQDYTARAGPTARGS